MSRNRVFVEVDKRPNSRDGVLIVRIFHNWRAASASPAYDQGRVLEFPRAFAVESIRRQIFQRANHGCERCGATLTFSTMHLHEKQFKGKGGEVSLENCQALCYDCHQGRKDSAHGNRRLRFGEVAVGLAKKLGANGMTLPRCPHGVYDPTGTGVAPYCSGCTPPTPVLLKQTEEIDEDEPPPVDLCPACEKPLSINPEDEYDFVCTNCGFDGTEN